jgi:hypothetical protein
MRHVRHLSLESLVKMDHFQKEPPCEAPAAAKGGNDFVIKYRMPPTWPAHVFLVWVMYFWPDPALVMIRACWYIHKRTAPRRPCETHRPGAARTRVAPSRHLKKAPRFPGWKQRVPWGSVSPIERGRPGDASCPAQSAYVRQNRAELLLRRKG